jgi:stearoyl-CoA desaturase (delta-9 desaturase)
VFDFVTMGELFQNNHHKFGMSPNFAARWFEVDPTYQIMKALQVVGIIDMGKKPQLARYPAVATTTTEAAESEAA